jgi:hypothetical protein
MYQIGVTDLKPTGVRSLSNVVVKVGAAVKTVGTDYTIDARTRPDHDRQRRRNRRPRRHRRSRTTVRRSREQVISGTDQVEGAILFVSANPEGEEDGLPSAVRPLAPNGDFALKSDEWQQLNLNVEILTAPNREAIYLDGRPYV